MHGIYDSVLETNRVSSVYNVAAVLKVSFVTCNVIPLILVK